MTDFPSDFERETRHHERAVDEHRHVEALKDALDLASRRRGGECQKCGRWVCPPLTCMACLADAPEELRAINADLTAEVERLKDELETANNVRNAMLEAINRLNEDRSVLLDSWIVEDRGGWQIRGDAFVQFVYATREQAEGSVLAWAHSIRDAREAGWDFGPGEG